MSEHGGREGAQFGEILLRSRVAAGLTQEALAERAGVSVRAISDLERGTRAFPRKDTLRLLMAGLDLDPEARAALVSAARRPTAPRSPDALAGPRTRTRRTTFGRSRLPATPYPLVGRASEIAAVKRLLERPDVRLLTLTGPGGTGKTRLAIHVAEDLAPSYPDGVVFVGLAPVRDPELVLPAIASALGLRASGGRDLVDAVAGALAGRRMLLLFDNFEHLLGAAPVVATLWENASDTDFLVTSRAPLHLRGEHEYPVPPFTLPAAQPSADLHVLAKNDAVAFFVDRARAGGPDFTLTAETAPAVTALCARLDGLPLAIELAAAWVKLLPAPALLAHMDRALPMLAGGARDAPARQRALRDTVAWSYDLLTPSERTLFRRLSVFVGGWTLEAAASIAGPDGDPDILFGLASLADKSLVRRIDRSDGEPRFAMLETIREFGLERLAASGEAEEARHRHAAWCLALAEAAEPVFFSPTEQADPWLARLAAELPNLRAAIGWLIEAGRAADALRLISATDEFWDQRHSAGEPLPWLAAALAAAPNAPAKDRVVAHHLLASAAGYRGDTEEIRRQAARALRAARSSGNPTAPALAHFVLGQAREYGGDLRGAVQAYAEAVRQYRLAGSESFAAWVLAKQGNILVRSGDLDAATAVLDEARMVARNAGYAMGLAIATGERGMASLARGETSQAAALLSECLALSEQLGHQGLVGHALVGLAGCAAMSGQAERGARWLGAVEGVRRRLGRTALAEDRDLGWVVTATREKLGDEAFARTFAAGLLGTPEEALADARALVAKL